ncbi:PAS domain S-box protein [Nocardioides sp. TF02-7]|uniref:PAS domain S-box protein n=1 Tax=Nocardioides sp. TF02-7 TaxID=2917724 RepID=UPI001F05254D|nr:PAS domain S-box protein [Nocardioides sp. TF02-7]UMG91389.1 PAS domain S-box protein [Nocardioides sp. TF02-7]
MEPTTTRSEPDTGLDRGPVVGRDEVGRVPTVVLVDDAVEVRTLVRARLRLAGTIDVVGEAASGQEAIELADRLRPDLVLLDVSMPGMDGLEALPRIRSAAPATRVVMYSGFVEEGLAERTLALGADAFFEKSSSLQSLADDLLAVLETGSAGERAIVQPEPRSRRLERTDGSEEPSGWASASMVEPVLREHLERFREVFDDAAIGMATMTLAGRLVRANPSLGRLTGRPVPELVAMSYADLVGADVDRVQDALQAVVSGSREVVQFEHGVVGAEDQRLLCTLSPVRDAAQRPLYLFLQVQDVSAQREAEEELHLSEQRFRMLVEAVQDYAIFMLDPTGHIASWNAGAQRIKGWTEEEIVGRHFRTFYPRDKQVEQHPEHELEIAARDGRYEEEGWRVRKDGTTFWAHVTITAVRDDVGNLVGFGKVTRDVTERLHMLQQQERAAAALAEANEQLETANQRLQQAAEDQAQFLALTAHELRSPVGVLGGSAQLLRDQWTAMDDDQREELLGSMMSGATRLQRLLGDLLTASRIRSSALDMQLEVIDLGAEVERTLRSSGSPGENGEVVVEVPAGLRVVADTDRLAQILENLVRNALLHGAAPVLVTAEPGEETVRLVIRDAGDGVPEGLQGRLFERFATGSSRGTGLGLYIVRVLARAQGGDADYRRDDGAFVVTIPAAPAGEEQQVGVR